MAADLHIHVFNDGELTDADFECFFGNTLGSKWSTFNQEVPAEIQEKIEANKDLTDEEKSIIANAFLTKKTCSEAGTCKHWRKIADTENIWIGEVSWLKAALMEDGGDMYVPHLVLHVSETIGEDLPIITDELIAEVSKAFTLPNNTVQEGGVWGGEGYSLAEAHDVIEFLETHKGMRAYTVSW